ncbi:endo-1,4-beta-xylanase [Maribacter sp.]|nr:endo-1,4-beta-xylanase [Maribacter sp.]
MKKFVFLSLLLVSFFSCDSDDGESPAAIEPSFRVIKSTNNPSRILVDNTTPGASGLNSYWQFTEGGEQVPDGPGPESYLYETEGEYTVTLTVETAQGALTVTDVVSIGGFEIVSYCDDDTAKLLANACDNAATAKSWVWSKLAGAYGVGPTGTGGGTGHDSADPIDISWYTHPENGFLEEDGSSCAYDDKYIFKQDDKNSYTNQNNGDYTWVWSWANAELGTNLAQFEDGCHESVEPASPSWSLEYRKGNDGADYPWILFSNGATIAYYEGNSAYQIVNISDDKMLLRSIAADPNTDPNGWRYYSLIREGFEEELTPVGEPEPDTALKSVATTFSVGMAVQANRLTGQHNDILVREFNNLTAEYEMKMNIMYPSEGNYDFTAADAIVDYGVANGMNIHGHALIWHSSTPNWVEDFAGTDAEFEAMVEDYITTTLTRYKGKVRSWDVVNEAIQDGSNALRNSVFRERMGDDYITKCFQFARNADPDVLLFYNDYNVTFDSGKQAAMFDIVDDLMVNDLIDGVGPQMHISYNFPSRSQIQSVVDNTVSRGLLMHFSELDIRANPDNDLTTSLPITRAIQQQAKVKEVVQIYNAIPEANKFALTIWGLKDNESWLINFWGQPDWPLLYDSNFNIKKAHTGFLEGLE